jgi:uncharacterized membrane protein
MGNTLKLEDILTYDIVLSYIEDCIKRQGNFPKELMSNHSIKYYSDLKELRKALIAKTIGYKDTYKRCLTLQDELMVNEKLVSQVYQAQVITMSTY